jgi:branched-chain amino acid transport system permease protein
MPRGIVNLAMKKGWLPPGRGLLRQLAREDRPAPQAPVLVLGDDAKRVQA